MNVKTKAITAMKMQTVQTLTAPSIVAVILDFLEMDSHAQVSNSKEFLHETECTIKHSLELLTCQPATTSIKPSLAPFIFKVLSYCNQMFYSKLKLYFTIPQAFKY